MWFEILKANFIRESPAMQLARELVIPYIQQQITELPMETLNLPLEGARDGRFSQRGRRVTGYFFNDIEVNTWLGQPECQQLVFQNEEWKELMEVHMKRYNELPYPLNRDPLITGGECNIQAAEYVMQAIVQRLPGHNVSINVTPLGWQGQDKLETRLDAETDGSYQCGFKYQYTPDTESRLGGTVETGNVAEKDDDDEVLW